MRCKSIFFAIDVWIFVGFSGLLSFLLFHHSQKKHVVIVSEAKKNVVVVF